MSIFKKHCFIKTLNFYSVLEKKAAAAPAPAVPSQGSTKPAEPKKKAPPAPTKTTTKPPSRGAAPAKSDKPKRKWPKAKVAQAPITKALKAKQKVMFSTLF